MAVQLEFLKSILYFSDLGLAELESIRKLVVEKTADRAEMVLLEGESAANLYFVASGVVKVFKTSAEGKKPTTVEVVRQRLRKVINPLTGLNVVRTNLVQDIKVKDKTVRVLVDLPRVHQFAHNIKGEILEKIEPLWDVKEVVVEFTE